MKPWRVSLFLLLTFSAALLAVWQHRDSAPHNAILPNQETAQSKATPDSPLYLLLLVYHPHESGQMLPSQVWLLADRPERVPQILEFSPLFPQVWLPDGAWQSTQEWQLPLAASADSLQPDLAALGKFIYSLKLPSIAAYTTLSAADVRGFVDLLGLSSQYPHLGDLLQSPPHSLEALLRDACRVYSGLAPTPPVEIRGVFLAHTHVWGNSSPTSLEQVENLLQSPALQCSITPLPR